MNTESNFTLAISWVNETQNTIEIESDEKMVTLQPSKTSLPKAYQIKDNTLPIQFNNAQSLALVWRQQELEYSIYQVDPLYKKSNYIESAPVEHQFYRIYIRQGEGGILIVGTLDTLTDEPAIA